MTHERDPEFKRLCSSQWLSHVRSLTLKIELLREQVERQRSLMEPRAIQYSDSSSPNAVGDAMQKGHEKLVELIRDFCAELAEYADEQRAAEEALSMLPAAECAALKGYYMLGMTWEQVCVRTGYTWHGMMKLRRRALESAYDVMPEQWRREFPNAAPN